MCVGAPKTPEVLGSSGTEVTELLIAQHQYWELDFGPWEE